MAATSTHSVCRFLLLVGYCSNSAARIIFQGLWNAVDFLVGDVEIQPLQCIIAAPGGRTSSINKEENKKQSDMKQQEQKKNKSREESEILNAVHTTYLHLSF